MNCDEARRHWNVYYDSEGDHELYAQINDHLSNCATCAEWFHQEGRLEALISERLQVAPTPELWQRVLTRSGLERPASTRRWMLFGGTGSILLALAASLLVGLWLGGAAALRGDADAELAKLTAHQHQQLASGEMACEFVSASDLEVEAYLRRRVSFPVRCPPRNDTGFVVHGAGISNIAGEDSAYVFGQVDGKPVSVFILSKSSLATFPSERAAIRRAAVHHQREAGVELVMGQIDQNIVVVLGPAGVDPLTRVLKAYGTYPHGSHSGRRA